MNLGDAIKTAQHHRSAAQLALAGAYHLAALVLLQADRQARKVRLAGVTLAQTD